MTVNNSSSPAFPSNQYADNANEVDSSSRDSVLSLALEAFAMRVEESLDLDSDEFSWDILDESINSLNNSDDDGKSSGDDVDSLSESNQPQWSVIHATTQQNASSGQSEDNSAGTNSSAFVGLAIQAVREHSTARQVIIAQNQ